ncbi:MAG: MerR family transcriptional regulator [Actinocrinis sp.]
MLIGELARRAGTSARTLRYYESHGLVRAGRGPNGYRTFASAEVRIVREIRTLLDVGFDLDEIRPFVACLRAGNATGDVCPDSVAVLRRKLADIEDCIDELGTVRRRLQGQLTRAVAERVAACSTCTAADWDESCDPSGPSVPDPTRER